MYIPNPHPKLAELAPNGQPKSDFLAWFNDGIVIDDRHCLAGRPDLILVKLLPEAAEQPKIRPRGQVYHTQGGPTKATNQQVWSLCARKEWKSEPHIIGPEMVGGRCLQAIPFNVRADSNLDGNQFTLTPGGELRGHISIETQDSGFKNVPLAKDPWTLEQLNILAGIGTALCATYGMSCGDMYEWNASGIAPHNRWPQFSKTNHNCPGPARCLQMDWVRAEVAKRLAAYYAAVGETCPGAA